MTADGLGDRIKNYENAYRLTLPSRLPVIIRLDGKSFHSYTHDCQRPFDPKLVEAMDQVAIFLCSEIQNAMVGYVQSDEISILLNNWKELNTQSWLDNNLQKLVSCSAGLASSFFSLHSDKIFGKHKLAVFDSRAFILPPSEVVNYFLWRQQDNTRNSVQMLARSLFSHRECENKNNSDLQEMIHAKGKNWDDLPTALKRGRCVVKASIARDGGIRKKWVVDNEIPIFSQDRDYIERFLKANEVVEEKVSDK
jgi:tRNA(His) guanylyltransferase